MRVLPSFAFMPMRGDFARMIAEWRYPAAYAFYDWGNDPEDLAELLSEANWPGHYDAAVTEDGALLGFLQTVREAGSVELGLGLRPDLIGQGYGRDFLDACLCFAAEQLMVERFTLAVASFNRRAIVVYERAGFRVTNTFMQQSNGGEYQFAKMEREVV